MSASDIMCLSDLIEYLMCLMTMAIKKGGD